jgi:hypothetical protein
MRITFADAYQIGRCTPHAGCTQGALIPYVGCYGVDPSRPSVGGGNNDQVANRVPVLPNWVFGGGGTSADWGAQTHTPSTCNTACYGFRFFALYGSGLCYCGDAGYDAFNATSCNQARAVRIEPTSVAALMSVRGQLHVV